MSQRMGMEVLGWQDKDVEAICTPGVQVMAPGWYFRKHKVEGGRMEERETPF